MKADKKLNKIRSVSYTKLALSFLLIVLKLFAGFLGNSTLLLADAIRSFSEFINESVRFVDLSIANRPEDESHNYGHGKIATLCMGASACILFLAGFHAFFLSSEELLMFIQGRESETPETIAFFAAVLAFVSGDIIPIFAGSRGLKVKENPSKIRSRIKDLFLSSFVIFGIGCTFLSERNLDSIDSLAAALLSLYILVVSGKLLYSTVNELIEASLNEESNRRIREIINKTDGVTDSGELKTRRIGKGIAINACISVHNSLSIREAAKITDTVEERLKAAFGENAYTIIKIEPGPVENQAFQKRSSVSEERRRKTVT